MTTLGQKSLDCLKLAALFESGDREAWARQFDVLAGRYSAKAVEAKLVNLAARGFVDYGVSAIYAWPTDRGREVLSPTASAE